MAEEAKKKKNNKNLIIGICTGVLVIAVIVVAIIFATKGTTNLNDAYFVSDNTKYVLTVNSDELSEEKTEITPIKTHLVYYYSGDDITGMITYMEFADEATAKSSIEAYKSIDQTGIKSIYTNGKYIVVEMAEDQYANITASDVKQQIEFMEMLKNVDTNNVEAIDDEITTETNETTQDTK